MANDRPVLQTNDGTSYTVDPLAGHAILMVPAFSATITLDWRELREILDEVERHITDG